MKLVTCPWLWSWDNIAVDPVVSSINLQGSRWRWVENTWYTLLLIQSVLYSSLKRKTEKKEFLWCSNQLRRRNEAIVGWCFETGHGRSVPSLQYGSLAMVRSNVWWWLQNSHSRGAPFKQAHCFCSYGMCYLGGWDTRCLPQCTSLRRVYNVDSAPRAIQWSSTDGGWRAWLWGWETQVWILVPPLRSCLAFESLLLHVQSERMILLRVDMKI